MIQHRIRFAAYGVAVAALSTVLAACGGGSSGGTPSGSQTVAPASGGGAGLTTHSSSLGTVVADSSGRTVYELVGNPASNSKCDSSCQAIWTPVMSGGSIKALHGHPLFTYTGDSAAGDTNGQNVTDQWGTWLALDQNGSPIAASGASSQPSSPASSSPASGGTGGYGY